VGRTVKEELLVRQTRSTTAMLLLPGLVVLLVGFLVPSVAMLLAPPDVGTGEVLTRLGQMLTDPYDLAIIGRTLGLGLITTILCLLLGFPIAYLLARSTSRWAGVLLALAIFPLLLSSVVRTFGWLVVLGSQGAVPQLLLRLGLVDEAPQLLYTPLAIVLGMTQLFLPLAVVASYSAVAQVDAGLDDAARGLGAGRIRTFWTVVLPLSLPGVVVASVLGGSRERVLATQLYTYASSTIDWAAASATALIMTVLVFAISGISAVIGRKGAIE
jgi:putative spermidine/putrescine transport system permease protein